MDKNLLFETIEQRADALFRLSDAIWDFAETAFAEHRSAEALAGFLRREGFDVEMPAYGVETAVVARYGAGRPCIGLLGEFDALANLAQDAGAAVKQSAHPGGNGHGCGHNLLGVGSLWRSSAGWRRPEPGAPWSTTAARARRVAPARPSWPGAGRSRTWTAP